jgi:hypothetical protein
MQPSGQSRSSFNWLSPIFGAIAIAIGIGGAIMATRIHDAGLYVLMLMGIVVLVAAVWKINWGLFTLVAMTYARISDVAVHYYGAPSIAQPFIAFLAVLIFLRWVLNGERPQNWLPGLATIAAYGLVIFLSLFYAGDPTRAQEGLTTFLKDAIIAVILILLIQSRDSYRTAAWGFLFSGILLGTIGVIQYLTSSFTNDYWGWRNRADEIRQRNGRLPHHGHFRRPQLFRPGYGGDRPHRVEPCVVRKKPVLKLLAGWALAASFLTVIFTFSRGGFLALCGVWR